MDHVNAAQLLSVGLILANGLQPILLIWTLRRGPDKPGVQPCLSPAQAPLSEFFQRWIWGFHSLMLSLAGVWSWVFLGGKMSVLSWSPELCAMIVIAWRITFPTRRNWFSWESGNGKDQRLRTPHLSSLTYLKEGIIWSWLWDIMAFKVFLVCLDVKFDTWQGTCTGPAPGSSDQSS